MKSKPSRKHLTKQDLIDTYELYLKHGGVITYVAKELGISRSGVRKRLHKGKKLLNLEWERPIISGSIQGMQKEYRKLPPKGNINTYILSSIQNNTQVHPQFLNNLIAYAKHINAEFLISQFTYNKAAYLRYELEKPNTQPLKDYKDNLWFDPKTLPYICNRRVQLAPQLVFCGEVNISPTAVNPLSGFETYTHISSAIFPHTTIALESIAGMEDNHTKMNYTTGTVSIKNYIQKKAGLKAEHHHTYGALVVEIDSDGDYFVRQLNATADGAFYDLDVKVEDGTVYQNNYIEAINWGDVHVAQADEQVTELNWGKGGILDTLKPRYQFMHDTIDFYARNHHNTKDPHKLFLRWQEGTDCVRAEILRVVEFLNTTSKRDFCSTIIVPSNHDDALERWLREADYKTDPTNAIFFLECQLRKYQAMERNADAYSLVDETLSVLGASKDIYFLRENESFLLGDQIECSMHGHLGPNGARGSIKSFAKSGRKTNTGHAHTAGILKGAYVAGVSGKLQMDYNKGLSSWSHSHIITYPNLKRCIITIRNNKYRGVQKG